MVLGHSAQTCAAQFGSKIAFFQGRYAEVVAIATRVDRNCDHPFSVAHWTVWGAAACLAWMGDRKRFDEYYDEGKVLLSEHQELIFHGSLL